MVPAPAGEPAMTDRRGWISVLSVALGSFVLVLSEFLPIGLLGASKDNPYELDVAKAKALLAKAGVPNGFNNLGLQTALYEAAPGGRTGSAGGLFQTFRYLGAISATATIGVLFDRDLSSSGLHELGLVMSAAAVLVLALALLVRRRPTAAAG